jgi:transcription elongation factor Elf1
MDMICAKCGRKHPTAKAKKADDVATLWCEKCGTMQHKADPVEQGYDPIVQGSEKKKKKARSAPEK